MSDQSAEHELVGQRLTDLGPTSTPKPAAGGHLANQTRGKSADDPATGAHWHELNLTVTIE